MARRLIEYHDVADAADHLTKAGKRATVIAIRDFLGKGSFTTISAYLKQWFEEHHTEDAPVEVVLPEAVVKEVELFLRKIYVVAKTDADAHLEADREIFHQKEREHQEDMQQAFNMAQSVTEHAEQLQAQLNTVTQQKADSDTQLNQSEKALSLKSAELARSWADMEKLEQKHAELSNTLAAQTADFTRTQEHLKQAENTQRGLNQKLTSTEGALTAKNAKNIELSAKLRSLQAQHTELKTELKEQLERKNNQYTESQNALTKATAHGDAINILRERLSEELRQREAQLANTESELRTLLQDKGQIAGQLQEKALHAKQLEAKHNQALGIIAQLEHQHATEKSPQNHKKKQRKINE